MSDTYDIRAQQNADLLVQFQSLDQAGDPLINLTGYEIKAEVRQNYGDVNPVFVLTAGITDAVNCKYFVSALADALWVLPSALTGHYDILAIQTGSSPSPPSTILLIRGRFILIGAATEPVP